MSALSHGVAIPFNRNGMRLYASWLPKVCRCGADCPGLRYVGYQESYYDGPIYMFGFWFFHFYTGYGR